MLRGRASGKLERIADAQPLGWLPNIQVNWTNWLAVSCTPGRRHPLLAVAERHQVGPRRPC
jgi:hypothetical protein